MIIDLEEVADGTDIVADLVIIGGGLAGLGLAREWRGANRKVVILESGGRDYEAPTQDLYAGSAAMRGPGQDGLPMDDYLIYSRMRYLGGTGNVWNGRCAVLDPWDFEERSWIPYSGWPFSREHMQPFYDRASDLLGVPRFDRDFSQPQIENRPPFNLNGDKQFSSTHRYYSNRSTAVDPDVYGEYISAAASLPEVTIYLHANVSHIQLDETGQTVSHLEVRTLQGTSHRAFGQVVVLAAGAIENARMLLASNDVQENGIGNDNDVVGRFFQGHVRFSIQGHVRFSIYDPLHVAGTAVYLTGDEPMSLYTDHLRDQAHALLTMNAEGQRVYGTAGFTMDFFEAGDQVAKPGEAVLAVASAVDGGSRASRKRYFDPKSLMRAYFYLEQMPNPESRIRLGEERDALGMRRVSLDWTFSSNDMEFFERALDAFTMELGSAGRGRIQFAVERESFLKAFFPTHHHMGSTRMNNDRRYGVVDSDSRVHGVRNLYVAGSSVFPTSGIANPTLTLVATTLRLSDHLKTGLGVH